MIDMLRNQRTLNTVTTGAIAQFFSGSNISLPSNSFPNFLTYPKNRYGYTIDFWINQTGLTAEEDIITSVTDSGAQVTVSLHSNGTTTLFMQDNSERQATWMTDPICSHRIAQEGKHHVAVVVDGGPKMIIWVVDGHLCDGGPTGAA